MELLPPVGWADVATKHDLLVLERRMDARFDSFEDRMDARFESSESRMAARFDQVDARFAQVEARFETSEYKVLGVMERELRSLTWKLFAIHGATMGAIAGALVAAIKL